MKLRDLLPRYPALDQSHEVIAHQHLPCDIQLVAEVSRLEKILALVAAIALDESEFSTSALRGALEDMPIRSG